MANTYETFAYNANWLAVSAAGIRFKVARHRLWLRTILKYFLYKSEKFTILDFDYTQLSDKEAEELVAILQILLNNTKAIIDKPRELLKIFMSEKDYERLLNTYEEFDSIKESLEVSLNSRAVDILNRAVVELDLSDEEKGLTQDWRKRLKVI